MKKLTKKELQLEEFHVQQWLYREFLGKLKKNNVKSVLVYIEDKNGAMRSFEHMINKKSHKRKVLSFLKD